MADLTKAMQAAAESARADSIERLAADAKAHIEAIHADSASEATDLRKRADDDVAAVREWSKTEIARIREETDERITHRKDKLEREIEDHAAEIEARIERVQARVDAFEAEMAAFFERLLAEDDPTRFAAMAESLPEPPPFDGDDLPFESRRVDGRAEPSRPTTSAAEPRPSSSSPARGSEPRPSPSRAAETARRLAETADEPAAEAPPRPARPSRGCPVGQADAADARGLFSIGADEPAAADPRLDALGLTPDFAAAEAEAAAFTPTRTARRGRDPGDRRRRARRSPGRPRAGRRDRRAPHRVTTRVVVTGLVSVASIAGFKRHLSRVSGVQSVGVSSGPEGEFVFEVTHDPPSSSATSITDPAGLRRPRHRRDRRRARRSPPAIPRPRADRGPSGRRHRPAARRVRPRRRPSCAGPASPVLTVSQPDELEALLAEPPRRRASPSSTARPTSTSRSSTTRCCATTVGPSRP